MRRLLKMKKHLIYFFTVLILLATIGCNKEQKKHVIPKDDFVDILVDIHLLDGIMRQPNLGNSLLKKDTTDYYAAILRTHNYSREQFDSTIVHYSKDIKEFDEIYQDVLSNLNQMEAEAEDELEQQKTERELLRKKEEEQQERLGNPYKISLGSKVKVKR